MADDFAANTSTTGRTNVNAINPLGSSAQFVTGNIDSAGDHDWFRVWLWSGEAHVFREVAMEPDWSALASAPFWLYAAGVAQPAKACCAFGPANGAKPLPTYFGPDFHTRACCR